MHRLRLAVVVALGSLAALACLAPAAGAQTRAGTTRLVAQALSGLGDLYLLRANAGLAARRTIVDLLEDNVPGWQAAVQFYWPE